MIVKELFARLGLHVDEASFAAGEAMLASLSGGFLGLAGVVTGAGIALVGMVKATANAGDEARKLSQRVGVDSQILQQFGYAAELSDISVQELATGLQHLAKTGVKDTRAEVLRLADQFQKMPDGAEKTKLAMEKFGRSGARMIPMLNDGAKGLAEMAAEAEAFGLVLSEDVQKESEEFNDQLTRLSKVFVGFRNRLVSGLIKPLTTFVVSLRQSASAIFEWTLRADNMNFILTLLTTAFTVLGLTSARAAVRMIAAWISAALPFIALAAAITLAALIIQDFIFFMTGDGESAIGRFVAYYKREFGSLKEFTSAVFAWIEEKIVNFFKLDIAKKFQDFFKPVSNLMSGFTGNLDQQAIVQGYAMPGAQFDADGRMTSGAMIPAGGPSNTASVTAPVTINVQAAEGMSTVDLAGKVGEHVDSHIRKASGGLF